MTVLFGVHGKFFFFFFLFSVVSFTASRFQCCVCVCGVISSWYSSCVRLSLTLGFLSQLSLSKPPTEIFTCVFFDAVVSDEQQHQCVCVRVCVRACVSVCLSGWGTGLAANPLRLPVCVCVCVCVCVWSAEGWEGSVADMKVKGESCLPTLPLGEPSGSWKSPGLPLSFSCL